MGGPDTPLPVSGSAQRLIARLPLGFTSTFPGSTALDNWKGKIVSLLRQAESSPRAMVLLVPSEIIDIWLPPYLVIRRAAGLLRVGFRRPVTGSMSQYAIGM